VKTGPQVGAQPRGWFGTFQKLDKQRGFGPKGSKMEQIYKLMETLAEEGHPSRLVVSKTSLYDIDDAEVDANWVVKLTDGLSSVEHPDGHILLDPIRGSEFLLATGSSPEEATNRLEQILVAVDFSIGIQKLAIAMEVELGWTPEECNLHTHWEDARESFLAEHFENTGVDMQVFWDIKEET
jgi:hypothetical protein